MQPALCGAPIGHVSLACPPHATVVPQSAVALRQRQVALEDYAREAVCLNIGQELSVATL
jgi:hypothetical protein